MTQIDNTQDSDRSSLTASQASGEPLPVTAKKHQHGKETSSHDNSSNLSPEELDSLEEEIVNAALLGCSERHRTLPKCFDNKGRLYKPWAYLKGRTEESKQRYKTQSLATTKRLVPTKRSPKTTTRDNLHPQPQSFNEAVRPPLPTKHQPKTEDGQAVCEKCLTASVELNLVSDGGLMKAICSSCLQADQACSSPLQKKAHQSIKKVETKRDSHRAGQAQSSSIEKLKHSRKESTGTRRNLRSSPADVQDEGSQTMAGSAIAPVPQQPNPEAIVETQRDHAPSPSPPKIQVLVPYRAETAHIGFAAQIAHDDIQGGVLRPTVTCRICPEGHCSCNIAQGDYQGLRCNDSTCGKGWFSGNYLEEHCGIQLSDAHDARKIYGNWFCPECAYKARRMRNHIGALEPAQFSKIPESGKGMFDDNEIQQPLKRLSGLILQYISTAQTKPLQPSARTSFLEIPCIRDETYATSVEGSKPLLRSLRFILDVHPGALVKERILSLHLQDQKLSVWICGVIVSLFWEFVFQAGSPFEDAAIWREGLIHVGYSPEMANMMIQDNRIRTMKEKPEDFSERVRVRYETHLRELDEAMKWLVGCRKEFHGFHQEITEIAGDLNAKIWAYLGEFEPIYPQTEVEFDPNLHLPDTQEYEPQDYTGRDIMMPTMIGIKYRLPGKEWRICSRAKVRMWPDPVPSAATPKAANSNVNERSYSRIVPQKRPYHDLTRY